MVESLTELQDPLIIKLDKEWFKHGYYVYVVVIKYNGGTYYYIGMTGDRKHLVARSPFYRMSGHFMMTKSSTQNQIIKGLRQKLGTLLHQKIGALLHEMDFTYYSWLIKPYDHDIEESLHHNNRKLAEKIESALIIKLREEFGKSNVFNNQVSRKDFEEKEIETARQIFEKLKEYLV